jgi:hypothetical protein
MALLRGLGHMGGLFGSHHSGSGGSPPSSCLDNQSTVAELGDPDRYSDSSDDQQDWNDLDNPGDDEGNDADLDNSGDSCIPDSTEDEVCYSPGVGTGFDEGQPSDAGAEWGCSVDEGYHDGRDSGNYVYDSYSSYDGGYDGGDGGSYDGYDGNDDC